MRDLRAQYARYTDTGLEMAAKLWTLREALAGSNLRHWMEAAERLAIIADEQDKRAGVLLEFAQDNGAWVYAPEAR